MICNSSTFTYPIFLEDLPERYRLRVDEVYKSPYVIATFVRLHGILGKLSPPLDPGTCAAFAVTERILVVVVVVVVVVA